jgi:hypothetical protein
LALCLAWVYLYFIKTKKYKNDESSKQMALLLADLCILLGSMTGAVMLLVRCSNGACDDDQQDKDYCNPRHDDHGLPTDALVGNLFLLLIFPMILKAHKTSYVMASYCVTFCGYIVAAIIAKATADATLIFAGVLCVGTMLYDYERNMMTVFLVIRGQKVYYDQLLSVERDRASAEIETAELRNLIGSLAHDLKTPLQTIVVELDGLQVRKWWQ